MKFWQLGNTSVRSALRIRDGLVALSQSSIQGNIRNVDGDIAFRELLGKCGVVSLGSDVTNSVGRKWRSAMGKLGFIYPEVKSSMGFTQDELGQLDIITDAGRNLINAQTVPAIQECYLRSMVAPTTPTGTGTTFSPLCWVLAIMLELDRQGEEPSITFPEVATIVITSTPADGLRETVSNLLSLRTARNTAERKRQFDRKLYDDKAVEFACAASTFRDYADMNIRYLKATGMVQAKGKGIILVPEKRTLAVQLTRQLESKEPLLKIYRLLCAGSPLPTDNKDMANEVLNDLLESALRYGIRYSLEGKCLDTPAQINQVRYEIEEQISHKKEEHYALRQADEWQEIAAYMDLIASRKERLRIDEDTELRIPRAEAPAYLEWSLWRAFLAIDSLVNKPYNVRRFNVDQDFMPVSTAPGNGADLIAEFDDKVIVIEATLSESSRQEAMEGEPVRRHVADLMQQHDKPVYGLFIANRVDSNTAETFRIGRWYTRNDERLDLSIVPFTLQQFSQYFRAMFESGNTKPKRLFSLMMECDIERKARQDYGAPEWKSAIANIVQQRISAM
ncbi:MAG: AlwI family type II restriction endonuclease [Eubacteriales bacterium]|nr:AlwI family type II restriction endonuclease [Eubacteriales bacterium]